MTDPPPASTRRLERRTVVVPDGLAHGCVRRDLAREGRHGIRVTTLPGLAVHLAGGFTSVAGNVDLLRAGSFGARWRGKYQASSTVCSRAQARRPNQHGQAAPPGARSAPTAPST